MSSVEHADGDGQLLTLGDYVGVLRRRRRTILTVALVVTAVAVAYALASGSTYRATIQVAVTPVQPPSANGSSVGSAPNSSSQAVLLADQAAFARSALVLSRAAALARPIVAGMTPSQFASISTVTPSSTADILQISVTASHRDTAGGLASAYAAAYKSAHDSLIRTQYGTIALSLQREIDSLAKTIASPTADPKALRVAKRELDLDIRTRAALTNFIRRDANSITVLPSASAPASARPSAARYALGGLLAGLVLGVVAAFVRDALDTRLRSRRQLARALGVPVLGTVPTPPRAIRTAGKLVAMTPGEPQAELLRILAARVDRSASRREARTLLVTSALEGEGASTTAANLAVALAQLGREVVLVDADIAGSTAGGFFGLSARRGLMDVLAGDASPSDVTAPIELPGTDSRRALAVVPAGADTGDPAAALASPALTETLAELAKTHAYVVVDSPPLLTTSRGVLLASSVDAIVVVARSGRLTTPAAQELRAALETVDAPTLGSVLTGVGGGPRNAPGREVPHVRGTHLFDHIKGHTPAATGRSRISLETESTRASDTS